MKRKKALAFLLAASMVFGLTGCMTKGADKKMKEKKEAVAVPEDIWAPYEEEVTLSTVLRENAAIRWEDGDDYSNNPWYREYKEKFNVKITNDWVSNDYSTKLNLTIAEGNLPDVFVVTAQQLQELQAADLIWDLTEVYDTQASDIVKGYMKKNEGTFDTGKIDGKLYAIPQLNLGPVDDVPVLWVKKDWKAETGIEEIKTVDDLEKMAKAIKEKHGDFAFTEVDNLAGMNAMATAWGAYPGIWVEQKDGTIGYGSIQPEMKEVLTTYARWYKEGLLDTEFTITDGDKMFQKVLNQEVGISPFSTWFAWGVGPGSISDFGLDGTFDAYPIPTATGEPAKSTVKFNNSGYIVVSKSCKNPDAALRLINYYADMVDGTVIEKDQKKIQSLFNMSTIPYAFRVFNTDGEYNKYTQIAETLPQGSEADLSKWGSAAEQYMKCVNVIEENDSAGGGEYLLYGHDKCSTSVAKAAIDNDLLLQDKLWGKPTKTLGKSGSTLDDILVEGFTKIIVGEESVDYFDTLVQSWNKAGGEQATKEVNDTYGK